MNKEILVRNIKRICEQRGVKPTVACRESGAGKDLINRIETSGSAPSVEKIQLLANYLGVTTSELLGEETTADPRASPVEGPGHTLSGQIPGYEELSEENKAKAREYIALLLGSQHSE